MARIDPITGTPLAPAPGSSRTPTTHGQEEVPERGDSLQQFLEVLARRKLVVLLSIILTPLAAFGYSLLQDPLYEASATVLASSNGVGSGLSALPGLDPTNDSERFAATQVALARLPTVAARVVKAAPLFEDSVSFLGRSSVTSEADADILRFNVTDLDPDAAARLATIYARAFANYRNELDVLSIRSTRASITSRLAALEAAGRSGSALYAQLRRAVRELDAAEAVHGSDVVVVQPAVDGYQIVPRMKRNLALGLVLGLVLGIGLAFLIDRLDKRIRSAEDAEAILGLPVLGELSPPPAVPERAKTRVSMVELPFGSYAEGIRKLRSNVEFANLDLGARVLMVTSAISGEGKTTVASDLAVALARSGRKVVLCDLDARAPAIARAFALDGGGLVEVAFGAQTLEAALASVQWVTGRTPTQVRQRVPIPLSEESFEPAAMSSRSSSSPPGQLHVLPLGRRLPPSPAEFVGSATVHNIISELAASHEIVILDTPPMLPVSDSLTISRYVDAALVVCGLNKSSRTDLRRVRKLLASFPTHLLGFVITGVAAEEGYGPYFVPEPASIL